jgi:hypothetical protein
VFAPVAQRAKAAPFPLQAALGIPSPGHPRSFKLQ